MVDKATDSLGLTKRSKVLGMPIGPRHIDWRRAAGLGAGTTASLGALGAAGKQLAQRNGNGGGLLQAPKELIGKGQEAIESVSTIGDRASSVTEAVRGESGVFGKVKAAVQAIGGGDEPGDEKKQRLIIQEQIDVGVPAQVAYDTWTDFDEFEEIFRAIQQVEDDDGDDGDVHMQAKILFSTREWSSEVTDQTPGQRIAWTSSGDVDHVGAVSFHELSDRLTRVHVEMEYHPTGIVEKVGNLFLSVRHRVRKDLRLFKHYLELKGVEEAGDDGDEPGYKERTRNELREELEGRGLAVAGTKAELIERLEADDRGEEADGDE